MPSETMPPPGKVSDALFLVRRPAPKAVKQRTPIKRTAPPKRSTKRIPRVNAERKAKRLKRYRSFLASAKWKMLRREALARARYRCQVVYENHWVYDLRGEYIKVTHVRCPATEKLHVDHVSYRRFGGRELPEDLKVVCFEHHMSRHALQGKKIA